MSTCMITLRPIGKGGSVSPNLSPATPLVETQQVQRIIHSAMATHLEQVRHNHYQVLFQAKNEQIIQPIVIMAVSVPDKWNRRELYKDLYLFICTYHYINIFIYIAPYACVIPHSIPTQRHTTSNIYYFYILI